MLKVLSLFSGIGAFEVALDEENIDWKLDHYCEIDKYACKSYNMIHGTTDEDNLKDVTNVDYSKIGEIDLVTYGFPCQDISLAGQQKGFVDEDGNLTRSGLFFNAADVIRHTKPKFAIFENVKNLTSKKFSKEFETVLSTLDELGYNTYWKVLNAKNYGIPQNRERVFGISIRKDIDKGFNFPEGLPLKLRLKDMLEKNVDEKYYLSKKITERFKVTDESMSKSVIGTTAPDFRTIGQRDLVYQENGIIGSLVATDYKQPKQVLETSKRLGGVFDDEKGKHQAGSVWDTEGLSPTLDSMQGGWRQPCIVESHFNIPEATKKGYKEGYEGDSVNLEQPNSKTRRGRVGEQISQTLTTSCNQGVVVKDPNVPITTVESPRLCIRKLTPRECWRLMGFKDKYFDRVKGISNTQLYKQAGNSIVVDVLKAIFRELKNQYPVHFVDLWGNDDL